MENQTSKCEVWARCIKVYLDKIKINISKTELRVVILCETWTDLSQGTSPKLLSEEMEKLIGNCKIFVYDGFLNHLHRQELEFQKCCLKSWLSSGGLLLTTTHQFKGCEADIAVMVGTDLSFRIRSHRNGLTRGVADLCFITGDTLVNIKEMSKHYDVLFDKI